MDERQNINAKSVGTYANN